MKLKLSKEEAIRLHREMWTAMREKLGNDNRDGRLYFKAMWCAEHFPHVVIKHHCLLCQYAVQTALKQLGKDEDTWDFVDDYCQFCPIDWPHRKDVKQYFCEEGDITWDYSDISDILALPEKKEDEV